MKSELVITIKNEVGLHARPAALFVKTAAQYKDTRVEVLKDGQPRDAKSLIQVLAMGAGKGTILTLREGPHADDALTALAKLAESDFGE